MKYLLLLTEDGPGQTSQIETTSLKVVRERIKNATRSGFSMDCIRLFEISKELNVDKIMKEPT